jgi:hypothetical protein
MASAEPKRTEKMATRRNFTLLMQIIENLRMPWIDDLLHGKAGFDLREETPVAIVVMTHIVMPQHHRAAALIRRAEVQPSASATQISASESVARICD